MTRNKAIGLGLILGGFVIILILGGSRLRQSGLMMDYDDMPAGRNAAGLPSKSITFANPMMFEGVSAPEAADGISFEEQRMMDSSVVAEQPSVEKKVIKNGSLDLRVDRVDEANQAIEKVAQANGGEVFSSNIYVNPASRIKSGSVSVKVPVANFQKTFDELKKVATLVLSESTSGQDVTMAYTDIQARLKNKQAEEASIAKILERSGDIDDVLKVTRELNRVRGEIEQLTAQIKYMDSQTDMATISVSMTEDQKVTVVDSWRPWQIAKDSVNLLIKKFQNFVNFVIVLVISILPVLALYAILVWVLWFVGKKIYLKINAKKENPQA